MGMYKEIKGDLIKLALQGEFDVIAHGCNCMCNMGAGIAVSMNKKFGVGNYPLEHPNMTGNHNKLGQIEFRSFPLTPEKGVYVVNCYSQYYPSKNLRPLDYEALRLCLRKINFTFSGKKIGLPMIGAGLAGGDWNIIKEYIIEEFSDCDVTVVIYDGGE
jgi:O-acetyl-ADP-ribose deacetylase (regulator of RNase III)